MPVLQILSGFATLSIIAITLSCLHYEKKTGVPSIPTLPWVRRKIIEALKKRLDEQKNLNIAELGCGWGGINLELAKKFPNSNVVGYEIAIFPYLFSLVRSFIFNKRVKIYRKSFLNVNLSVFDVLVCYLSPVIFEQLKPQLADLKPGTLIISNAFAISGWQPEEILHTHVGIVIPIYVYKV